MNFFREAAFLVSSQTENIDLFLQISCVLKLVSPENGLKR